MKDLKNLKGAKVLGKTEQKAIKGGVIVICDGCPPISDCCVNNICGKIGIGGKCYAIQFYFIQVNQELSGFFR